MLNCATLHATYLRLNIHRSFAGSQHSLFLFSTLRLAKAMSVRLFVKSVHCDKTKKFVPTFLYLMKVRLFQFSDTKNGQ